MTFKEFNFRDEIAKSIEAAGFKEPSPVQEEAIPYVLDGHDMIAQAHTGTGKTAAFGLPILNNITCKDGVEALVIVPTRELATQVSDEIFRFGKFRGINTATVYGGTSYSRQINHVQKAAIVVATPGRLLDLLKGGKIDIMPKYVVLDEADEMLDMGFLEDIKEIFSYMPSERQTLMFSATMPHAIRELAKTILHEPKIITITKGEVTNNHIKQLYYVVEEFERDDALIRLLDYKDPVKSIIFCRMKKEVDRLSTALVSLGYSAKGLHGDMEQRTREEVIRSFKKGNLEILIATDVAARGLDVSDVSHVFNYHIPFDNESYVHRIGRTGRAGRDGTAISIVTPHEFKALQRIQKSVGSKIENRVIPTVGDVRVRKTDEVLNKIREQGINPNAIDLVDALKDELDLSSIAHKLAAIIINETAVKGNDKIGKNKEEVERLIERAKYDKGSGGGGRNRNYRGRSNRGGGGRRRGGKG